MEKRRFGWTGAAVPPIGQGTWDLPPTPATVEALRLGLELGLTHIDAAEMYNNEEMVGRAIRERVEAGRRDELFLVSKVLPSNATRGGVRESCRASLRRMHIDRLDLYLLHWRGSVPLRETMEALEDLVDEGLTRWIGVSNFDVEDMEEAIGCLTRHRLACNQVLYHLGERGIERRLIPFCRRHQIAVVAYSPFGNGGFPPKCAAATLRAVATRHGKTPGQVALNFLLRLPEVFVVPKAARQDHIRENAAAADWRLTGADIAAIDRACPAPERDTPLAMI